ncbi:hypothetical protein E6C27_scaffold468G001600 [Cucumis melo var. makuwa]|uniref:Uncharacterized protein n=1 Tax=Cucumis melo var. makuwa TaxID=1194695 RepID=A0A5A7V7T8_CUCMM|nr:hypothetical protein E6C27_scaffold468G001600 [Cucumis melo var. makuwa]
MALQRVKTVFDGRWIESWRYIDYRLLDVYVPVSSSFQEFANGRRQKSDGGKATVEDKATVEEKRRRKLRWKNGRGREGGNAPGSL